MRSGRGGNGIVAWRREKYEPRGGPAGGCGGWGGDVILQADSNLSTLLDLEQRRLVKAESGRNGGPSNRTGARGAPAILLVPLGTQVRDLDTGELLADLREQGAQIVVAQGGKAGRGNSVFATATRRAPDFAEQGEPGEERVLRLTLKLLADVGIVGFPNSGKSTFIARISNARPKIADYPFTTLVPSLGVVQRDESSFVVADIPGLIEGASEGAGLGFRFLRHIERTAIFLMMLDLSADRPDALHSLQALEHELAQYDPGLGARTRLVTLNKIDLPEVRAQVPALRAALAARGLELWPLSAVTGEGVAPLLSALAQTLGRRGFSPDEGV